MKKKIISAVVAIVIIMAFLLSYIISYANTTDETIYVNLTKLDPVEGIGYGIMNPSNGTGVEGQPATSAYIWNLTTYKSDDENAELTELQRNLYCVKANYGATWEDETKGGYSKIIPYNLSYDLQKDRGILLNLIDDTTDTNGVVKTLLTESGYYRELLWILDNSYIESKDETDETSRIEFLESIGIKYDKEKSEAYGVETYTYEPITGYDYSENVSEVEFFEENLLTEADIKAVQKAAIWYYTNYMQDKTNDAIFNQRDNAEGWLTITSTGTSYTYLTEYLKLNGVGPQRAAQAQILYNYLIDAAEDNVSQYASDNDNDYNDGDYILQKAVEVDIDGLTEIADENEEKTKYRLTTTRIGSNYVVGPITINKNNNSVDGISMEVTDPTITAQNKEINYTITNKDGESLGVTTVEELLEKTEVGTTAEFYITVSRASVKKINIKINVIEETTTKTLWLRGTEEVEGDNITSIELGAEQPLVEVNRTEEPITTEFEAEPNEFDLALRKYITALYKKGEDGKYTVQKEILNTEGTSNVRALNNIGLDSLQNGTTATYNHRKDPVVVEDEDEVTYTLRIYNEGNNAGYATQIIDQLPTGLIWSTSNSNTITAVRSDGEVGNTYTYVSNAKDISDNKVILEIADTSTAIPLNGYTTGNLEYETIEIKCIVAQEPDMAEQIVLTNVAWISEAYDSDTGRTIPDESEDEEKDRDSEPDTSPSVNKSNMEDYRGNTNNTEDLSNDVYHYGEQDDDDFEKLVIMPVNKIFDLELVKFIAAVSKDEKIDEGEYLTDTKNSEGIYDRAPKISIVQEQDSEKRRIHCDWSPSDKIPVLVEAGDYVLYTIRVYNAGELDGYASLIKDHLPLGLEFVETTDDTAEYYGIWNVDEYVDENGDERQILSTDELAKGQGKEAGATEGDENYQANLLKALKVDEAVTDGENRNPDYRDVQVLCRVTEDAQKNSVLVNYAQISNDTDEDGNDINDEDSTPNNLPEEGPHEDDEDLEKIELQCFDLSLRKFITAVNGIELKDSNGKYTRAPVVDVSPLQNGSDSTAIYNHPKEPVAVQIGYKVVYTIRVYNEGDINGFASEVKDYLPPYLTYDKDNEINTQYGWQISEDGRIATTDYLSNTELKAFDGTKLDYADLKIACIVSTSAPVKQNQTNIAEISEYTYNGNTVPNDIDSESDNMTDEDTNYMPEDKDLPSYKDEELDKDYVPGNEDDDDFEKVYVKQFDLALRKFITKIQENEVTTRVPQVKIDNGAISYEHPKDPITLHVNDIVIYTLRIYNEGEIDGYASEITDDIPEYLEYLPEDSTNVEYMWKMYDENGNETENVDEAVKVKTTYLSKENGEDNLIKGFDGTTLDYKDIKIAFKVKDPNSNTHIITNHAQISDDTDENGDEVTDKDSKPDEWNEGEDDQDIENIKVEYFDLSLLKFVTKVIVIEDGKETITETGYNGHEDPEPVVKVELHKKKLDEVVVKFGYGITITNESDIPGYATEITDYVPEGLRFDPNDNPEWMDEGNNVISTRQLEGTLLQPGESATVEVILTWINGANNLALKTNTAEISEDDNEYDVPDRDSTPDNKQEGEDDIDIAKVILSITTGAGKTYFTLAIGLLTIVLVGVVLIKKFVI